MYPAILQALKVLNITRPPEKVRSNTTGNGRPESGEKYTESKSSFYEYGMFEKMNYYCFLDEWEMVPGSP